MENICTGISVRELYAPRVSVPRIGNQAETPSAVPMKHLYETIADEIVDQIECGLLRPGDRLPGVRTLSTRRAVSIATAVAAYRKLEDHGYIQARPRSGFFVRARLAAAQPETSSPAPRPHPVTGQQLVLQLVKAANDPAIVQLGAAVPAPAFLPTRAVEQALARAARRNRLRAANYEFPPGAPELRRQIARRMAAFGCRVAPEEIVITDGCQEAIMLALRAVTAPGDVVAIESPTFYGLLQVIETLGLKALEIPTHPRTGIALDALQLALEQWHVKACVVVPNYSNPLGYCMPEPRKRELVELLARHGVALIEDDVCGDLGFSAHRPSSAKTFDRTGNVLYCASFSKTLSPGLRIGWIAPGKYRERIEYLKYVANLAASSVPQLAVAELLESGRYERHLKQVRGEYARAVERMTAAIARYFPAGTKVTRPEGGFVLWVELPGDVDTFELARKALANGVSIAPGPIFSATQRYRNFLRISCACVWDERVEKALTALARML